ncbi:hypothetical protein BDR03DRAFT_962219 [Suillus americanus]|nr:hypothetical protein BDR03DRAFT_962219 [Suillus americanus]
MIIGGGASTLMAVVRVPFFAHVVAQGEVELYSTSTPFRCRLSVKSDRRQQSDVECVLENLTNACCAASTSVCVGPPRCGYRLIHSFLARFLSMCDRFGLSANSPSQICI